MQVVPEFVQFQDRAENRKRVNDEKNKRRRLRQVWLLRTYFYDTSDCLYISDGLSATDSHGALKTVRFSHRSPIRAHRRSKKPRMFPDY